MCREGGGTAKIFTVGGSVDQSNGWKMRQGIGGNDHVPSGWLWASTSGLPGDVDETLCGLPGDTDETPPLDSQEVWMRLCGRIT